MKRSWKKAAWVALAAGAGVAVGLAIRPFTASGAGQVDGAIEQALALDDAAARERALLALAAPGAEPAADAAQLGRISSALEGAPERVRLRSIEIEGPLALAAARAAFAEHAARFRACQLRARDAGGGAVGHYTLRFRVAADGRASGPGELSPASDAVLSACFAAAVPYLSFAPPAGASDSSAVALELRVLD